jgi:hypothetical protein
MNNSNELLLLQGKNITDLNSQVSDNCVELLNGITTACFSPKGRLLAFLCNSLKKVYVVDISIRKISSEFSLYSIGNELQFVDEEHLLCRETYGLCLINIESRDVLTRISFGSGSSSWKFSVSRKSGTIVLYDIVGDEGIKLGQLWLPNHRKDATGLPECSCTTHAVTTDPPSPGFQFEGSSSLSQCSLM